MFSQTEAAELIEGGGIAPFPSAMTRQFFTLSYYTGFSVDTTRNLKWKEVNPEESIIEGDGKKQKITKIVSSVLDEIKADSKNIELEGYLFTDSEGSQLTEKLIEDAFKKTMESAGIDYKKRNLTPNSFRRTFNFWYA